MIKKSLSVVMAVVIGLYSTYMMGMTILADDDTENVLVEHKIEAGESPEGNPLKGFVPYDELTTGRTTDFPHSLEWFYVPVKAVQTGMDTFDWTAVETRLDAVAARGHQAVFRLYYDYPSLDSGVPDFLVEEGLLMRPYDEPDNLGGGGLAPDYNDPLFRASMANLIAAFGQTYDGDPRIGYITLGLLGFWGEWHTWPFDEDTSDDKEDWSIQTEVFEEVLQAFDAAFDVTGLCVREPKWGIDYTGIDVGFHDDSFAYATVSEDAGGQSWSFMSKVYSFDLGNRYETNCIGGEVYPPTQKLLFETDEWVSESGQTYAKSLEQTHATWLINEEIKNYEGQALEAARLASVQLGYDFRIETATYKDQMTDKTLNLNLKIVNQGTGPFYYDHRTWPLMVGVFDGDEQIEAWETDWDLNTILPGSEGSELTFETAFDSEDKTYTLGIKVLPPLENGNVLKFANAGQRPDGWMILGDFTVGALEVLDTADEASVDTPETSVELDTEDVVDTTEEDLNETNNIRPIAIGGGVLVILIAVIVFFRKAGKTK